ncbi:MAG: 2-C-methyl-D-erythritol 2,4-cyclodiphosphate synthase [Pseudomonadota bacterium]|jgi:2-C-methyl-D-erythritol 4-phosphate cytidylyltransferase/2-C-methyl-D-erythritol 2,4-cyclodiphosphate synthase|nr:2-C-methyl-D-erythritol 2,4-cyclodiphosphate synthase [Pseudomonadota bacterium]MED5254204.1 2-C-methyl-D-erythritol 2,4-cyclodiphosphate synthase [Pseudomonadota bacterium]MED5273256.1 2-C-methyl-D-erythritol 2,4-cyclodiphosphate synthase [Pseudomonadota bacterium]MED5484120.1 2-C-methyl-D-erythritol 2,4-cyclodiphosphate synthase [Pseudomonadota bacterium]|tara:strand:- start:978 stop:2141 length:1164 start_codon:yes stop_codon:yes gene_type:complete
MIHFIILAAGKSERFKKKKNKISKQFYKFRGISPLEHLITSVSNSPSINSITLVINKDDKEEIKGFKMKYPKLNTVVSGGNTRQKSVFIALKNIRKKRIKTRNDIVLIHDAARPFLENRIIENCILHLKKYDGVFPALNTDDTLRNKKNLNTYDRDIIISSQTPQAFKFDKIYIAHKQAKGDYSDDVAIANKFGLRLKKIEGQKLNFKITNPSDIVIYEKLIDQYYRTRVGNGFDFHKFKKGKSIKLGGLKIKSKFSLEANSDGDPILHSITDAILGALNEKDIGFHFEPDSKTYKNVNSVIFINKALKLLKNKKGEIINLDLNIICDYPKINPIRDNIRNNLSKILKIKKDSINIKATSTEDEGFVNTKKGIACQTMISLRVFDYA